MFKAPQAWISYLNIMDYNELQSIWLNVLINAAHHNTLNNNIWTMSNMGILSNFTMLIAIILTFLYA